MFKKIIVCLDRTPKDKLLIENACKLSKTAGTEEIIFLNIIKDFNLPDEMSKEFPHLFDRAVEERKAALNKLVKEYFKCSIKTRLIVCQGSLTKEILKKANETKADLIIQGRTIKSNSVLSSRTARRSPCSLLLIPENHRLKTDKIFIPVDFSDYSDLSLKTTLELTKDKKSEIFLQNVINIPSSYRYSGKSYQEFGEIIKSHLQKDLDILIKKVAPKTQQLTPVFTLDKGESVMDMIWDEARRRRVDLIVMGAKGRTAASAIFIGSKAEKMIRINYAIPLLIIRKKGGVAGILETLKEKID
ncbi:MAG: universal stress protein [Ekhidna sp.]|nr:universal stress protein [Ekhidna sp.]MBC6410087.1 universal stress protein [Ekhidna sp.]MBC6425107.1 universal stress protein [Ekhidna sp.]